MTACNYLCYYTGVMGALTDKFMADLEGKRKNAAVAVAAYVALLKDGKKIADPKTSLREKIDVILPPIAKFKEIVDICKI